MRMRTVNYDALAASAPLNKDAAVARDGGGEHWTPAVGLTGNPHWSEPRPLRPVPATMQNLAGTRFGRMVCIGLLPKGDGKNSKPSWLCRCACGDYEPRTARAIANPTNRGPFSTGEDCCIVCGYSQTLAPKAAKDAKQARHDQLWSALTPEEQRRRKHLAYLGKKARQAERLHEGVTALAEKWGAA